MMDSSTIQTLEMRKVGSGTNVFEGAEKEEKKNSSSSMNRKKFAM
jgi:hypothetical protein